MKSGGRGRGREGGRERTYLEDEGVEVLDLAGVDAGRAL
jgi:hypothetical protein